MKKTRTLFALLGATMLLGACAHTPQQKDPVLTKKQEEVLTQKLEQDVRENSIRLTKACMATVKEAFDLEKRTGQKIVPVCVANEKAELERLLRERQAPVAVVIREPKEPEVETAEKVRSYSSSHTSKKQENPYQSSRGFDGPRKQALWRELGYDSRGQAKQPNTRTWR